MPESTSDNDDGKNFEIAKRILSEKRIAKKKNLSKTTIEHQIVLFFDFLRMFLRTWPIRLFGIKTSVNEQQNIFAEIVQAIQNDAKRDANPPSDNDGKTPANSYSNSTAANSRSQMVDDSVLILANIFLDGKMKIVG